MKRKLLLLFGFLISITSYSQEWYEMMDDPNLNFYEVQKKFYEYFETHDNGRGTGYKQFKRWEYIMKDQIDAEGNIIGDRVSWSEVARFKREAARKRTAAISAGNWTELGPRDWSRTSGWNPGIGRVTCIAVDKKDNNVIYIGSPGGGLWKTTSGGNNWIPLTDNLPVLDIYAVEIDPNNSSVVYMGTAGGGILKSTNAGSTWTQATSGIAGNARINRILIDPTNTNILIAATSSGMYRSTNGGVSWGLEQSGGFNDAEFKPGNSNIIYATGDRFYKSTDKGDNFALLNIDNGDIKTAGRAFVSVTPANSNYVYVVQARGSEFGYFYKSTNGGDDFDLKVTGNASTGTNYFGYSPNGTDTGGQAWYDMAMCASTTNAEEVYIGGIIIWKTTNGGSNFTAMTEWIYPNSRGYTHPDMHALEYVNGGIYSGSDGGIYRSTNAGEDWLDLSKGLGIRQFYRIGCSKTDPNMIAGGAQDNGSSIRKSTGWIDWLGADGMETIIDHSNSNIIYGTTQNGGLNKSTNGGQSRAGISTPSGNGNWVTPWVMDKSNSNVLFLGYNELFKTTNGGSSWTQISNFGGGGGLDALEVAPSNSNYIYASKGGTIWRTTNGGSSWDNISSGLSGSISYITVHPTNPQKIAVSTSGSAKVYISSNAGSSWTNYTANLPNISSNCVVFQQANDGLYVGMGVGIYYRDNTMSEWTSFMSNLPNVSVRELEVHAGSGKLRAATYGRGLWESPLYSTEIVLRDPENPANTENGVEYSYYQGTWDNLPDFTALTAVKKGKETNFNLTQRTQSDNFGFMFTGYIDVPADGQYTFYTSSDDGSRLSIGSTAVVNNDGLHGPEERSGTIGLKKGKHAITVVFFEKGGGELLTVSYEGPGISKRLVPDNVLYRKGNQPPTVSITAPANNATFLEGATITVSANASDPDGTINRVEFFHGTTPIGSDNSSPYSVNWTNVAPGTYSLTAKAFDNETGVTTSSPVTITVNPLRNADNPSNAISGVEYSYYEGSWNNLPSFSSLTPVKTGNETNFNLTQRNRNDDFGFMFHGYIDVPANGLYTFYTSSDDGSRLFIGNTMVVDNDGLHGTLEKSGSIGLKQGKHEIFVTFFERGGGEVLDVSYQGPGISKQLVPSSALYRVKTTNKPPVVSITSPSNGAQFNEGATINFGANASDPDGSIARVIFMRGTDTLDVKSAPPFSAVWSSAPIGNYVITAIAVDNEGAKTTSAPITIVVSPPNGNGDGLTANYFNGMEFQTPALSRKDANINFNWGTGSPDPKVNSDQYSARWTGQIQPKYSGEYTFYVNSDNGRRLWINNQLIIDKWVDDWDIEYSGKITLTAGQLYDIKLEYFENNGGANCKLEWSSASQVREVIPQSQLYSNALPAISISTTSATFTAPASISVNATTSDADGSVSSVSYYNGIALIATVSSPYTHNWNNVAAGTYTITAIATDNRGAVSVSAPISVTVNEEAVNQLPSVSITSPANNASFSAGSNITIGASASDSDGSITKVEFFEGSTPLGSVTSSPYSVTWNNVAAGTYQLTAVATDDSGATKTSAIVNITVVKPNVKPSVSITSPANNASFNAGSNIAINASASDSDGSVTKVEFFAGATPVGTATSSPYTVTWNNVAAGTHQLTAVATDDKGATNTSTVVNITVVRVNAKPTVSITSPANNATFNAGANITFSANASDDVGISNVTFYRGGSTLIGSKVSAPYSVTWNNVPAGTYTITAVATDNESATTTSSAITITVKPITDVCSSISQYVENGGYSAGSRVKSSGSYYECKPWPYSGWCNGAAWAYAPGTGSYWTDAWVFKGSCTPSAPSSLREGSQTQVQNSPNPFTNETYIKFTTEQAGNVSVVIFNEIQQIEVLFDGYLEAGEHDMMFAAKHLPKGAYYCKIVSSGRTLTHKLLKQ